MFWTRRPYWQRRTKGQQFWRMLCKEMKLDPEKVLRIRFFAERDTLPHFEIYMEAQDNDVGGLINWARKLNNELKQRMSLTDTRDGTRKTLVESGETDASI